MQAKGRRSRFERIHLLVRELLDELKAEFEQVQKDSVTDSLTGLANRRALEIRLQEEVSRARRYRHELAVVMMDIDHFKRYNDVHGHRAGDEILRYLGWMIGREVREPDVVARYGGEEFALLLPETGLEGAHILVQRIRDKIISDGRIPLTLSYGLAVFPRHADDPETLLEAADEALYAAKKAGRNAIRDAGHVGRGKKRTHEPSTDSQEQAGGQATSIFQPVAVGFDVDEQKPVSLWIGQSVVVIHEAVVEEGSVDGVESAYHVKTDEGHFRLVRRNEGWYLEGSTS